MILILPAALASLFWLVSRAETRREAFLLALILFGAYTVFSTELLGFLHALRTAFVSAAWLLLGIVALVLLLACTNLASFQLARALDRGQEIALRRALGATRGALARQLLVENALLGLGGAAGGLVLALVLPFPGRHRGRSDDDR